MSTHTRLRQLAAEVGLPLGEVVACGIDVWVRDMDKAAQPVSMVEHRRLLDEVQAELKR